MVSVIVPNRDGREVILDCLDSLKRQTVPAKEIIVVDDASTDGSPDLIRERFPEIKLIELESNTGFAGACVEGLNASSSEWVALLNSDAVADPAWLAQMLEVSKLDERVGAVACRVMTADPPGKIDSLGMRINRGGIAFLRGQGEAVGEGEDPPTAEWVFGPAGSAAMYRKAALDETGFFEPDFFAYYEDVDLATRLNAAGWKCLLADRAKAVHRHSYTADRLKVDKRYYLHRNRLRTILMNWPASVFASRFPFIVGWNVASVVRAVFEGNALSAFRARRDFVKGFFRDLEKRGVRLAKMKISPAEFARRLDLDGGPVSKGEDG